MKTKTKDADLAQSMAALRRAGQQARELAARTRTPLVTYRDGKVCKEMVAYESQVQPLGHV